MCYSTQLILEFDKSDAYWNKQILEEVRKRSPVQRGLAFARPAWPVVTVQDPNTVQDMLWGFIPAWFHGDQKEFLKRTPTFNAVSETAFDKPSFRDALRKGQRCLVMVTAFFEHQHVGKQKIPHTIGMKHGGLFALAGIYENGTYSILTCPANPMMEVIHNTKKRMPVIIAPEDEPTWLNPALTKEDVLALCKPFPEELMHAEADALPPVTGTSESKTTKRAAAKPQDDRTLSLFPE